MSTSQSTTNGHHNLSFTQSSVLDNKPPLVVDLDGTLIYSDLLWESIVIFLRHRFLQAWRLPLWLFRGKAGFKSRLAEFVEIDPATLPYDKVLVGHLRAQRVQGRHMVLATGSQRRYAESVANHLQLFDTILASDQFTNLTARNKADALVALYGKGGYDYIGNARIDTAVWQCSRVALCVTRKPFVLPDGRRTEHIGSFRADLIPALFRAMRPRQWLKNILVFLPMLAAHAFNLSTALQSLLAFLTFSMCASSAYLLNDALDSQDDRLHPTKKKRPIAAGELPLPVALLCSPLLAFTALGICGFFDTILLLVVFLYLASTIVYSLYLKRLMMVDIVTLSILYTLRMLGGAAATGIVPSFWLLAFSFFIFLSLAFLKRHSELFNLHSQGQEKTRGRGYTTRDKTPIGIIGINTAILSVLVFMLYFNSPNVLALYPHPTFLLGIVPLLVFWLGRLWMLGFRGEVHEDPVLFVSKDKVSIAVIAICLGLACAASIKLPT